MKTKSQLTYTLLLAFGIIVLVNILSDKYFFRLDLTKDNRYTLSKATKTILRNLPEPVTITAYFSKDASPELDKVRRSVKELLVEYSNISKGQLVFEMLNPDDDEQLERQAQEDGVSPQLIPVQDKNLTVPKEAYLGMVVQLGRQKEVLPVVQGDALEYTLSSTIKKMSVTEKPIIGLLQGHGEPRLQALSQARELLTVLYNVQEVNLNDSINELLKYSTIAIVAPKDSFPPSQLAQLDEYLAQGGDIYMAIDRVTANLQQSAQGTSLTTGLEGWLEQKGLIIENNFVIDAQCGAVGMQDPRMPMFTRRFDFPYIPVLSNFEEHPITKGLEAVIYTFASSLTYVGDSTITFTPLVRTSDMSGTEAAPTFFNIQRKWTEADFPLKGIALGGILEGQLAGKTKARMVVFSDGEFAVSGNGQQAQQQQPDNINLMVNAIDWLSDDTGLIELRTKGATIRPLDEIENSKKVFLKYFNFLFPIVIVIVFGLLRYQMRQSLRVKRMEEGYV